MVFLFLIYFTIVNFDLYLNILLGIQILEHPITIEKDNKKTLNIYIIVDKLALKDLEIKIQNENGSNLNKFTLTKKDLKTEISCSTNI